jgi:hypothetical protein
MLSTPNVEHGSVMWMHRSAGRLEVARGSSISWTVSSNDIRENEMLGFLLLFYRALCYPIYSELYRDDGLMNWEARLPFQSYDENRDRTRALEENDQFEDRVSFPHLPYNSRK